MKEITLSFIQYSSWPVFLFLCIFLLRKEVSVLLKRIRGIKAGTIELQFTEQLHNQGFSKEQLEALSSLSAEEIDIFLLVSFTDHPDFRYSTTIPANVYKARILKLQDAGLLQITNPEDPGTNLLHNITPIGQRLRTLLINSTTSLLRESA